MSENAVGKAGQDLLPNVGLAASVGKDEFDRITGQCFGSARHRQSGPLDPHVALPQRAVGIKRSERMRRRLESLDDGQQQRAGLRQMTLGRMKAPGLKAERAEHRRLKPGGFPDRLLATPAHRQIQRARQRLRRILQPSGFRLQRRLRTHQRASCSSEPLVRLSKKSRGKLLQQSPASREPRGKPKRHVGKRLQPPLRCIKGLLGIPEPSFQTCFELLLKTRKKGMPPAGIPAQMFSRRRRRRSTDVGSKTRERFVGLRQARASSSPELRAQAAHR